VSSPIDETQAGAGPEESRTSAGSPRREAEGTTGGRWNDKQRSRLLSLLLVAPLVLLMLFTIGFPLLNTVLLSFQNQGTIGTSSEFVGTATYRRVWGSDPFWASMRRSGVWLVGNLVLQTIFAFTTALLLQRSGRWARSARVWVLMPWIIPTVAVAVIWQWLTNSSYGPVPRFFSLIGIENVHFFADRTWAMPTLIFMNSWRWFPLGAVIIFGALQTIPKEIEEAAEVDGASSFDRFRYITLPLLQPVLFALGLVGALWSFNIVDSIYLVTQGGPASATETAPVYIYNVAFGAFRASQAAAASVTAIALLAVLTWFYIRFAKPEDL
jgi:multiple sugar transport system permease protein